jgi:hypothetical protein
MGSYFSAAFLPLRFSNFRRSGSAATLRRTDKASRYCFEALQVDFFDDCRDIGAVLRLVLLGHKNAGGIRGAKPVVS